MRKTLALLIVALLGSSLWADTAWTGALDPNNLWSAAGNWDTAVPAFADDNVTVQNGVGNPAIPAGVEARFGKKLHIQGGKIITVNGGTLTCLDPKAWGSEIRVGTGWGGPGTLEVKDGLAAVYTMYTGWGNGANANGTVNVSGGQVDLVSLFMSQGTGATTTVNINGGELRVGYAIEINKNGDAANSTVINVFGGAFIHDSGAFTDMQFLGDPAATAVFNVAGGMLKFKSDSKTQIEQLIADGKIVFFDDAAVPGYASDENAVYTVKYDGTYTTVSAYIYDAPDEVLSLTEDFNDLDPSAGPIYGADDQVEHPALNTQSGFVWGGYAEPNDVGWPKMYLQKFDPIQVCSFAAATRNNGTYIYTLFSKNGDANYTSYVPNMDRGTISIATHSANGEPISLRVIVRNGEGNWYVSNVAVTGVSGNDKSYLVNMAGLTWQPVNPAAAADMDELDGPDGPGPLVNPEDPTVVPDLSVVTGGGIMLADVTDPFTGVFRLYRITWNGYKEPVEKASLVIDVTQNDKFITTGGVIYNVGSKLEAPSQAYDDSLARYTYRIGGWAPESSAGGWNVIQLQQWGNETNTWGFSRLSFSGAARTSGAYFYTIFSDLGTNMPLTYVPNLDQGNVSVTMQTAALENSQDIHLIVRNGDGDWYISSVALDNAATNNDEQILSFDVAGLTWKPVPEAAMLDMNELDSDSGPGPLLIDDPNLPPVEDVVPDLSKVTGAGLYMDDVANDATSFLRIMRLSFSGYIPPESVLEITENINEFGGSGPIYHCDTQQETPQINGGSGFPWGGYADPNSMGWAKIYNQLLNGNDRLITFAAAAYNNGSYIYTLFSDTGNSEITRMVTDLDRGSISVDLQTAGSETDFRFLVRDLDGNWFVSSTALDDVSGGGTFTVNVADLTWKAVSAAAQADMNEMDSGDAGPGSPLFDPASPDVVPDLSFVTGGGLYMDDIPAPHSTIVRMRSMTWHGWQPPTACGQTGTELANDYSGPDGTPDCYVDLYDFGALAMQWLACTDPQGSGCAPVNKAWDIEVAPIGSRVITLDGNLSDWADVAWVDANDPDGVTTDLSNGKVAYLWDGAEGTIYLAGEVNDSAFTLSMAPGNWDEYDSLEFTFRPDGVASSDTSWKDQQIFDVAQQWRIAADPNNTGGWVSFAVDYDPSQISAAAIATGNTIRYEAKIKLYDFLIPLDLENSTPSVLTPGKEIMHSIDFMSGKTNGSNGPGWLGLPIDSIHNQPSTWARLRLVDAEGGSGAVCGDWGYSAFDLNQDCSVDLSELGAFIGSWLDCTDPTNPDCSTPWLQ